MTVAVAGGGIAGLAAAIGLARAGTEVTVFEQALELSEIGAGVQLGPNAAKALRCLGVWDRLLPHLTLLDRLAVMDGVTGKALSTVPLGEFQRRFGAPYASVHRADLLDALAQAARAEPSVAIETGARVLSVSRPDRPIVHLDSREIEADAVVGADGIHSAVRRAILGVEPAAEACETVFRALVDPAAAPAVALDAVTLWLLPGGHAVAYPLRGGRLLNLVLVCAGQTGQAGGGEAGGGLPELALSRIAGCAGGLLAILGAPPGWRTWPALDRPPLARPWTQGRVTLVGDAAHPSLPYLAQGAAMALEDAATLAAAARAGAGRDWDQAFRACEAARRPRTDRMTREARRQGWIDHLAPPVSQARNLVMRALPPSLLVRRLDWIYRWEPMPVPR